jgi:hypothetical protein
MKEVQESHMMDEVVRLVWSSEKDALNADVPTWTAGITLPCGIDMTGGSEQRDGGRIMVRWDALIRLPLGTTIDLRDRFRIASRFGQSVLSGTVYEIVSPPEEGPSGIVLTLRKVEPSE